MTRTQETEDLFRVACLLRWDRRHGWPARHAALAVLVGLNATCRSPRVKARCEELVQEFRVALHHAKAFPAQRAAG